MKTPLTIHVYKEWFTFNMTYHHKMWYHNCYAAGTYNFFSGKVSKTHSIENAEQLKKTWPGTMIIGFLVKISI